MLARVLAQVMVALVGQLVLATVSAQSCDLSSFQTPLCDLGPGLYVAGHPGGLYPGGTSLRPTDHEAAGLDLALNTVGPRDAQGAPDPQGLIGLISIGMSNTTQEFGVFVSAAGSDTATNPQLVIVDGAQGGQAAEDWVNNDQPWNVLAARIANAGLSPAQVQVLWMKQANRTPFDLGDFPLHAGSLQQDLEEILRRAKLEYPNLTLAYLSSRTRAGTFVPMALNPEPFAFESGFSVRWVLEDQLNGTGNIGFEGPDAVAPWVSWGPYLWADGEAPRSDGLVWLEEDLTADCTHPAPSGRVKVADQLLAFFKTDATTAPWYLAATDPADAPVVTVTPVALTGPAPLSVDFTADATPASGLWTIVDFAWGFDDGTTSRAQNPTKTFLVAGDHEVALTVSDSEGHTTRVTVPVTVEEGAPTPPTITGPSTPLGHGTVGTPYSETFTASGTPPIAWSVISGNPPPGLALAPTGFYSGTPTATGTFTFTVQASNSEGVDSLAFVHGVVPASGEPTLEPIADAYCRDGGFADSNFGNELQLAVRASTTAGQNARTFLKFDLGGISTPCTGALLTVFASGHSPGTTTVTAFAVDDDSWSESGITWNGMPPLALPLDVVAVTNADQAYTFDVTSFVTSEAEGDQIVTIALADVTPEGALSFFESREGPSQPPILHLICAGDVGQFVRGDCNDDGSTDISDAITLLDLFFGEGVPMPPGCEDACDGNDNGSLEIADVFAVLNALFGAPPTPLPEPAPCGIDPTDTDPLGCVLFTSCP